MPFLQHIQEELVERTLESIDDPIKVESTLKSLEELAPRYLAYVFSEDSKLLKTAEQDLLTYIVAALWQVTQSADWKDADLSTDEIAEIEDENWHLLQSSRAKDFRSRMDVFFEDYPQEELLALIEDLLNVEEEAEISKEGRDHVFIRCKTFLDMLIA